MGRCQPFGVEILSLSVGPFDNNAYLLVDDDDAVLVDSAQDAPALKAWIGDREVSAIITTHRHPDHIAALPDLAATTDAWLAAGSPDVAAISDATGLELEGLWDGDLVGVGNESVEVIGLVGHTPGGIALAYRPEDGPATIITGDSLFPGGVGKTTSPETFAALLGDVQSKLFDRFGDDTVILPGHGAPTTLGTERPHLEEWRARGW